MIRGKKSSKFNRDCTICRRTWQGSDPGFTARHGFTMLGSKKGRWPLTA